MSARSNAGRIGVWGASGSGKSSYVKKLIRDRKRMVIFDTEDEYADALPHIRNIEHVRPSDLDLVRKAMMEDWSGFRIAYVPPSGKESAALSALCKLLKRAQQPFKDGVRGAEPITLVVEEMNLSFPVSGGAERCPGFADLCSRGRKFGIEIIGASQRIAEVSTRFRGNCTETVVLRQEGDNDITAAAKNLALTKAKIASLEDLQWIRKKGASITEGKITFPKRRKSA